MTRKVRREIITKETGLIRLKLTVAMMEAVR